MTNNILRAMSWTTYSISNVLWWYKPVALLYLFIPHGTYWHETLNFLTVWDTAPIIISELTLLKDTKTYYIPKRGGGQKTYFNKYLYWRGNLTSFTPRVRLKLMKYSSYVVYFDQLLGAVHIQIVREQVDSNLI